MTNHPGRKPGRAQQRMTPEALRDIIARAGITQARAAELARVEVRTMERYLSGDRAMPLSASGLLAVSLVLLGAPAGMLAPWIPQALATWPGKCAGNSSQHPAQPSASRL